MPEKMAPSTHFYSPLPCISSSAHSPVQTIPRQWEKEPLPSALFLTQSPIQQSLFQCTSRPFPENQLLWKFPMQNIKFQKIKHPLPLAWFSELTFPKQMAPLNRSGDQTSYLKVMSESQNLYTSPKISSQISSFKRDLQIFLTLCTFSNISASFSTGIKQQSKIVSYYPQFLLVLVFLLDYCTLLSCEIPIDQDGLSISESSSSSNCQMIVWLFLYS